MTVNHGGRLSEIVAHYQRPVEQWLDLSTGIAPLSYPIPNIPERYWQQLPQTNNELILAARAYYLNETLPNEDTHNHQQCHPLNLFISNGSQSIIKALPNLWIQKSPDSRRVYLPQEGYKEHLHAWKHTHLEVVFYQDELPPTETLDKHSVLVLINPNNPTGKRYSPEQLHAYQQALQDKAGLLIVDEAFIDVFPQSQSLSTLLTDIKSPTNTIILRSFGKFFGLAGIRIGFALTSKKWCEALTAYIGPWQVNGPAQYIATQALLDKSWQRQQRQQLQDLQEKLSQSLHTSLMNEKNNNYPVKRIVGCNLFQTVYFQTTVNVEHLYHHLCLRGIYVRLTDEKHALRFGLARKQELPRLTQSLLSAVKQT